MESNHKLKLQTIARWILKKKQKRNGERSQAPGTEMNMKYDSI